MDMRVASSTNWQSFRKFCEVPRFMQASFLSRVSLRGFLKNLCEYFDRYLNDFITGVQQVFFQLEKVQFLLLMDY